MHPRYAYNKQLISSLAVLDVSICKNEDTLYSLIEIMLYSLTYAANIRSYGRQ